MLRIKKLLLLLLCLLLAALILVSSACQKSSPTEIATTRAPTSTPSPTVQTPLPTITSTPIATVTATPTPSPVPTLSPSPTVTFTPTVTPTLTPTVRPTPTPTYSPTVTPTRTPIVTGTPDPNDITAGVDFTAIDSYAVNTPASQTTTSAVLGAYLVKPAKNDMEKARAIYRWITQNISYDVNAYFTKNYGDQSAGAVLSRRTAVCDGYARLFQSLGQVGGLSVDIIPGWSKGLGYTVGDNPVQGDTDHAWNAVKINGREYLLDATWGAGYVNDSRQFVPKFNDFYFLTLPSQFIYDHFPQDSNWQLLSSPISQVQFATLPVVKPAFFEYGMKIVSPNQNTVMADRQIDIILSAPPDVIVMAGLEQGSQQLAQTLTFVQREGANYQVSAVFPNSGDYKLSIYAKRKSEQGALPQVMEYRIVVGQGLSGPIGFPKTYASFAEEGAYLYTPKTGNLQSGTMQIFSISVPRALDVAVIIGNSWTHLQNQGGGMFSGQVKISAGEIGVYAQFPEGGLLYSTLLVYTGI